MVNFQSCIRYKMSKRCVGILLVSTLFTSLAHSAELPSCNREPPGQSSPKTPADNRFQIKLNGQPTSYVPGKTYTVSLLGEKIMDVVHNFTDFMLVVEPLTNTKDSRPTMKSRSVTGDFVLLGDSFTSLSKECLNTVIQASTTSKSKIEVLWTAPPSGSGCIVFRATVVELPDLWFMDDGPLSRVLCEESHDEDEKLPEVVDPCCACEEAKYEISFEGLWSRLTHPKNFPNNSYPMRFSDVIGASHTASYRFWEYGGFATEGLRQVAEEGSTRMLESELKAESEHIRTIIKARGIGYPNVTGKTFAVFRSDQKHHLVSLVSMIRPSPDWIVGISGLELCVNINCTWLEGKELNLYPWDAGTDSGITYESEDLPSTPREPIRRITSSYPNDQRSPFYDPSGREMKPLARLYITRQRLYEKSCGEEGTTSTEDEDYSGQYDCDVTEWSEWSPCSVTCGKGVQHRQRFYVNLERADMKMCQKQLTSRTTCYGEQRVCGSIKESILNNPMCELSEWSSWSSCSVTCGQGVRTRSRQYKYRQARKQCMRAALVLEQTDICEGATGPCQTKEEKQKVPCQMSKWSMWSPCSVTCGKGRRVRTRQLQMIEGTGYDTSVFEECDYNTLEEVECEGDRPTCQLTTEEAKSVCLQDKDVGPCRSSMVRWFFDKHTGKCQQFSYTGCRGNQNNFFNKEDCEQTCHILKEELKANQTARLQQYGVSISGVLSYNVIHRGNTVDPDCVDNTTTGNLLNGLYRVLTSSLSTESTTTTQQTATEDYRKVDCIVTRWSNWSQCSVTCGRGKQTKTRQIKVRGKNGGKPCPKKLQRSRKCNTHPCDTHREQNDGYGRVWNYHRKPRPGVEDCELSEWSPWSPCPSACGMTSVTQRTRRILRHPTSGGVSCGLTLEVVPCNITTCKG